MEVDHKDLWMLLLSTVRYSMGRSTYMTSYAVDLVCRYEQSLQTAQLMQIAEEIEMELLRAENAGRTLGMDMDHDSWKQGVKRIRFIVDGREE